MIRRQPSRMNIPSPMKFSVGLIQPDDPETNTRTRAHRALAELSDTTMNKCSQLYAATQLMTIEEAQRLSTVEGCELRREERQRARMWSWQTVEGALDQSIGDEQIEMLSSRSRA